MTDRTYTDEFTLDGRVKPAAGVTKAKVAAVRSLVEATLSGDRQAKGRLEEAMTTSDAIFSFGHLVNVNVLPQFERAERTWTSIAGVRSVSDFRKPVLYSMSADWSDGVLGSGTPNHVAPVVPETAPYPYSYMSGEESATAGVVKRGFKTDFSFERFIDDAVGFIAALPQEMLRVALDTEEYEVYSALIAGAGAGQQVDGGPVPTGGTAVTANPVLSRDALIRAQIELSQRQVGGRQVRINGGYNLIVPVGQALFVNFILNQTLGAIETGTDPAFVYQVNGGYNPLANITVIESEYVTGQSWYLVPKPGTTARPVLERLQLIGHESPELRVENATGNYVGGGAVSPFEGSFSNDTATFRLRQIGNGTLWTPDLVIWSDGSGS